jgi:hypothetical protein
MTDIGVLCNTMTNITDIHITNKVDTASYVQGRENGRQSGLTMNVSQINDLFRISEHALGILLISKCDTDRKEPTTLTVPFTALEFLQSFVTRKRKGN